ncbi:hypothetical protein SAMN05216456_1907 [Devosia crocina]|uniref:Uncharacterized protein n=1 Tax=Devosia crocina TaxID=429728 RepID=A0A1I7NEQ8_9HYPH|nr:hypothetical protein [Devosia crocina]SFV33167.1 hypothetical protein SAMN05216456_1907 [Devosia crocina]
MSRIYAAGAAMGWTVAEVKRTSMWEFWAAWHGYVNANSPKEGNKLSESEKDYIWERLQEVDGSGGDLVTQTYLWDGAFIPQGKVSFRL